MSFSTELCTENSLTWQIRVSPTGGASGMLINRFGAAPDGRLGDQVPGPAGGYRMSSHHPATAIGPACPGGPAMTCTGPPAASWRRGCVPRSKARIR